MAAYNREQLEELTKAQLLAIATEEFGAKVSVQDNKDTIITAILEFSGSQSGNSLRNFNGFPGSDGIFDVPPKHAVLEIQPPQWDKHKRPVFISVNGKGHYIPVETPVCVHEKYLYVLKDAKRYEVSQKRDAESGIPGKMKDEWKIVTAYPFQLHFHNKSNEVVEFEV